MAVATNDSYTAGSGAGVYGGLTALLPSYVPSAGQIAQITQGGGVLTNNFRANIEPFYLLEGAMKSFDFSSSIINPHWGTYGAMIHFGGGHSSTNYNAVHCLEFGASTMTWKRLVGATAFYGTGTDDTTKTNNTQGSITMDSTYKEVSTGVPAAPHTYDARDILGPSNGGASCGTLFLIARAENSYAGANPILAAHKVDFSTTTAGTDGYSWQRAASGTYIGASGEPPYSARLAPAQGRIYFEAGKAGHTPIYFDLNTSTYVDGSGAGKTVSVGGNGVSLLSVPERDLQLYLGQDGTPTSGKLQIQYRRCGAGESSIGWSSVRTLSANIAINGNPITATWCPLISRVLVGCVHGDYDCIYEIQIPTDLDTTWTCTRRAFTGGQTIDWAGQGAGSSGSSGWPYGGWNALLKSWVIVRPSVASDDRVFLYRPVGT